TVARVADTVLGEQGSLQTLLAGHRCWAATRGRHGTSRPRVWWAALEPEGLLEHDRRGPTWRRTDRVLEPETVSDFVVDDVVPVVLEVLVVGAPLGPPQRVDHDVSPVATRDFATRLERRTESVRHLGAGQHHPQRRGRCASEGIRAALGPAPLVGEGG